MLRALSRRDVLASGAMGVGMMMTGCVRGGASTRGTIASPVLLVHGAWHGGWCWDMVTPLLEREGARVLAPSLAGLAERAGEMSAAIGLETHIADIAGLIEREDFYDLTLVGHSYGGMIITAIADRMPERLRHVVWLDAALPSDGQSMVSYNPSFGPQQVAAATVQLEAMAADGIALPPFPPTVFGIPQDHPRHDWVARRLTPHPLKTWLDPVNLRANGAGAFGRTYVHCTAPVLAQSGFPGIAKRVSQDPAWNYRELATGHDAMVTAPQEVASLILEAMRSNQRMREASL